MGNTPNIRFKGFADDWERHKVTELGDIYIGLVTTMTAHYTDHGTLLIRNSDIKDGKFEFDTEPIYLDDEFAEANKSRMHKIGDVITVHTGDVGTSAVITENEVNSIGFATIVTRPNKEILDSYYLSTFLNTDKHKNWAVQMSTGDGRTNYNLREYTELIVPIPAIDEQKKIAEYIMDLNNLITLHQRKYDEVKQLKKFMLQKMFPKNGELIPEIRFAGFTGNWEQRKAADIAEYSKGNGYSKSDLTEIGTPIILYGRLYTKYQFVINEVDTFAAPKESAIYSEGNEVIIPASGETAEDIARASAVEKSGVLLGSDLNILRPFDFINPLFLALAISNGEPQKELAKRAQGKSVVHIHNSDIQEVSISYPTRTEQDQIVAVFRNLDSLITLHQHKCDQLKEVKRFMLQNMFPQKG